MLQFHLDEAIALCRVFVKLHKYCPMIMFPIISKLRGYYYTRTILGKDAIIKSCQNTRDYVITSFRYMYNRAAIRLKLKPIIPKLQPPDQKTPDLWPSPLIADDEIIKKAAEDVHKVESYEPRGKYCTTREMIESYLKLRSTNTNIEYDTIQYLVKLPNNEVCIFTNSEVQNFFTYKDILFSKINGIEFLPVPRTIPEWILYMYEGKYALNCSYFLKMSYSIRKYLTAVTKPCKKLILFKVMQQIYNDYEFHYGYKTSIIPFYLDIIEVEYVDFDTFLDILRLLGYTVKCGEVMYLRKRQEPKHADIISEMARCKGTEFFNHKLVSIRGNDWRAAPKTPFCMISPFNVASL